MPLLLKTCEKASDLPVSLNFRESFGQDWCTGVFCKAQGPLTGDFSAKPRALQKPQCTSPGLWYSIVETMCHFLKACRPRTIKLIDFWSGLAFPLIMKMKGALQKPDYTTIHFYYPFSVNL